MELLDQVQVHTFSTLDSIHIPGTGWQPGVNFSISKTTVQKTIVLSLLLDTGRDWDI